MQRASIPIGIQNLLRTSTGGVAFAQPPAIGLNPYRMKTDDVKAEQKILIWQKYRTQKNGYCIFLRSIFLPLEVVWFGPFNRFAEAADYFALAKHSFAILCPERL